MRLIDWKTGRAILIGSHHVTFRCDFVRVVALYPERNRIKLRYQDGSEGVYFPSVIGAAFDPSFP